MAQGKEVTQASVFIEQTTLLTLKNSVFSLQTVDTLFRVFQCRLKLLPLLLTGSQSAAKFFRGFRFLLESLH